MVAQLRHVEGVIEPRWEGGGFRQFDVPGWCNRAGQASLSCESSHSRPLPVLASTRFFMFDFDQTLTARAPSRFIALAVLLPESAPKDSERRRPVGSGAKVSSRQRGPFILSDLAQDKFQEFRF